MSATTHKTSESGFLLPSVHSIHPFFTQEDPSFQRFLSLTLTHSEQPNPNTNSIATSQWSRLILAYARHRRLFTIRVEDADITGGDWDEILRNERINRRIQSSYLSNILQSMVSSDSAVYDPPKQTRAVLLYWRRPEEWAETLHEWASSTGQLNTILTFYDITDPPIESPLSGIPLPLLKKAIAVLCKTGRAQLIGVADGEGVRFFP